MCNRGDFMNDYQYFSMLYDELTEEMDYNPWIEIVKKYNGTLLDVGCGSGSLLIQLKQLGYDCCGIDLSANMLELAKKKFIMNHLDIPVFQDNMLSFSLQKKFDIITCFFDTLNHLNTYEELSCTLCNMSNHLNTNGVLIVDLFTKDKMNDINNEEFTFDEATYFATWLMKSTDKLIVHDLEFKIGNNIIKEKYIETFFDIKKILPNNLSIIKEVPIIIDNVIERIVYIIKK